MAYILLIIIIVRITTTQLIGYPIYYISDEWYRVWMDWTKQLFGILITFTTQFLSPLKVHMTGNKTVEGLFHKNPVTGHLETDIGERAIVISNHQLYTDWVYLWWFAFTAKAHGSIYIMLKKSLRKLPLWGWGMMNYRFFFLSRSWAEDEKVLTDGLSKINKEKQYPAWLVLFPEGTTISANGVRKTTEYSLKHDPPLPVPKHVLIPRARGLRFSLEKLHESIEYLYDATIYYEGVPDGAFGEEYYSIYRMYFDGNYPKSVHMYWRKYRVADIPWQDESKFEQWLQARWAEKDKLLESMRITGKFQPVTSETPAHVTNSINPRLLKENGNSNHKTGNSNTNLNSNSNSNTKVNNGTNILESLTKEEEGPSEVISSVTVPVELNSFSELFKIFIVPVTTGLIIRLGYKTVHHFFSVASLSSSLDAAAAVVASGATTVV